MLRYMLFYSRLLVFSTIVFLSASGCDESIEFHNTPPGNLSITRDVYYTGEGDRVTLTGRGSDADGDSVTFWWTAEAGEFLPADGKGQVVVWTAPDQFGTYRVTFRATDGLDEASKGIDLDVGRKIEFFALGTGEYRETDYPYVIANPIPLEVGLLPVRIGPGVKIVFNKSSGGIIVKSSLNVEGTEDDRVVFIANSFPGERVPWKGIRFTGELSSNSLEYATFSAMSEGLVIEDSAAVVADNIMIDQSSGQGISVKSGGYLTLISSKIWDNGSGLYVVDGRVTVTGSSLRYNGNYAFSMISSAPDGPFTVTIRDCVVANNYGMGFSLSGYAAPSVNNCSIFLNGPQGQPGYTLVLSSGGYIGTERIDMTGNYWGVTEESEIEEQINRGGKDVEIDYSGWLSEPPVGD